ncbi:MAG: S1/P1 nuclease [Bryobacterales bacterium]|nr:S1/P1 nuclease [Bryobacterales bacterium]
MLPPALMRSSLLLAAWLLSPATALGWSEQGHRIVALAAQEQLSENSKKRVEYLLGRGARLVDISTWADEIIQERPETEAWHSITIPKGADGMRLARDCPIGDCITAKARDCIGIMRLAIRPIKETREALKMLVGLAADLHQPLLSGFPPHQSSDDSVIEINGVEMTLFEAWDQGLLASLGSEEEALERVRQSILAADKDEWLRGTLLDWTWENHQVAASEAYPALERAEKSVLEGQALESAAEIVIERLAKSAVRLAAMLEDAWP